MRINKSLLFFFSTAGMPLLLLFSTVGMPLILSFWMGCTYQPVERPLTVACYYFPNYHTGEPRNEAAKGTGWSEWALVKAAIPRFEGHEQPKVPLWGYGDERDPQVMAQKIDVAADHGVDVFIFDWYMYEDGPFLNRCLDDGFLKATNRDRIRFSLMWANHDWIDIFPYKRGTPQQVVYPAKVSPQRYDEICDHLIRDYFTKSNYWLIDGKAYFSIYDIQKFVENFGSVTATKEAMSRLRQKAMAAGLKGVHWNLIAWGRPVLPGENPPKNTAELIQQLGFDSATSYVWIHHAGLPDVQTDYNTVRDTYFKHWDEAKATFGVPYYPNVTMGWDSSPRCHPDDAWGNWGYPFTYTLGNNTPANFKTALQQTKDRLLSDPNGPRILNINCWNEWTEGSYLEPDTKTGMAYLNAVKDVFKKTDHLQVYDLRCENLTNPLGIAATTPRFSWKMSTDRIGAKQKAYQLLVASDSLLLFEGKADLWNSGKVKSPSSVMVPYNGAHLAARSFAYWRVGVWDDQSRQPVWSDIASFSIGLLSSSDYTGSYIGFPREAGNPENPLLYKQFELKNDVEKLFLHVNSLGYHDVYINGQNVGIDVLSPSMTQLDKRSQTVTYDVSTYIQKGRNDLIIWLGRGWYQPGLPGVVYDGPLVKAQMAILSKGQWETLFATDATWQCRESGYTGIGNWRPYGFGGERVEADKLMDHFTADAIDGVDWRLVKEVDVPKHAVTPRMTEPNRVQEVMRPKQISPLGPDSWLVDMGKTLTGFFEIEFPALTKGREVVMTYADHLVGGQPANQGQIDRYIASGKNRETFRNRFNYHGFRYVKLSNLPVMPSLDHIKGFLIHTDYKDASSFRCSDPEINAIHDMIQHALRCLSLSGYIVDCPQIERLGYGGDGNASTQTAQTMFDLSPLYVNWMQAWADCIREDGSMPHTAPNPYKAGGGPYWCGFIITASWKTYINYGDSRLIANYYPVMQHWLEYVNAYTVDGLLDRWPDTDYRQWYLGDWATPTGVDQTAKPSVDIVNNCFISVCYETMEKIATVLGKTDDKVIYARKKEQLRKLIHERFFNAQKNSYATGSQIDLIYPMLTKATPEALIAAVTQTLFTETEQNKDGHLATGLVGIPVLTEWAIRNRSVDWVYGMLKKKTYPGYLYMIENGATATWEHWNGARSHIHNCYNGIGAWFYQAIGGIRPDENYPGYRRVIIAPQTPEGITWAKTSKETPYGTVVVDWEIKDNQMHLQLTVPPGSTAVLELPEHTPEYTLNGKRFRYSVRKANVIPSGRFRIVYPLNEKSNQISNNPLNQTNMKSLKVPYVPSLDGLELCEVAKRMETEALRQNINVINWKEFPYKPIVVFDIARGDKELYIHYFVRGLSLRAMAGEDGEFVHPDSCVEFFMRQEGTMNYTNFEFNCIGTCLAARGDGRHGRVPFVSDEYKKIRRCSTVPKETFAEKTGIHQWELTVAIPFALMGLDPSNLPETIRGNFYKCADETVNPHFVTWSPIALQSPDYHCPEHFGEISF